ncbi:uroporphyrinogen-III synthase [Niastella yeongjuensis]|uniref:uroporphyrinogen-III synthase n=1 Tax=Niastella yeongjuensis TaxID=354355 RepID=UPI0008BF27D5|nr:uroporphyrinogen-III synthase [Niastella yeongjuensis]SEN67452.1 uroporphyrinogen-III synthase [Niastella yeongjuensis]
MEKALLEAAKAKDVQIDIVSFIDTSPAQTTGLKEEIGKILKQPAAVVFTSMNAVNTVAAYINGNRPHWDIFCIGNTTRQQAARYFGEQSIQSVGNNASDLADKMIASKQVKQVVFFCGDQRREELPGKLRQNGIAVQEVIVYHTISTPHKVEKAYDGILFFSPSAVQSFFYANAVPASTVLFAIGQTTADAIKSFTHNLIIESERPGKDELVKRMFQFFKK